MRRAAIFALTLLLALLIGQSALSEGMQNKIGLSVRGGVGKHFLSDTDYFDLGLPFLSTELKFGVHKNLMVGLIGTYGVTGKKDDETWYQEANSTDILRNYIIDLAFYYYFAPESKWDPYLNLGVGMYSWKAKDEDRENVKVSFGKFDPFRLRDHEVAVLFGAGLEYHVDEYFSLGFGGRFHYLTKVNSFLAEKKMNGKDLTEEDYLDLADGLGEFFAGITVYYPAKKDSDKDGVPDKDDACPETPLGCLVDVNGCPLDADGDGVCDGLDKCPDTPRGCKVDLVGCPSDADGDGVCDGVDRCADTPMGVKVDAKGCALDSDQDAVPDYKDKCPNTPRGCKVDADGCKIDSDGDGVCDGVDRCPDAPGPGMPVDAYGCLDIEKVRLEDVNFRTLRYDISPAAQDILDAVYNLLVSNPGLRIKIEGHCDATGTDAINNPLSLQRANAVRDHLIERGIDPGRLETEGFGSKKPIADNATREGRAKNRRVEFRILR
jgi:outer membrane protein OmpA-like peptidoglycan-associated protein/opacity protein-like surface antigen